MADEDPRIAAFARTNRRRNATITLILGALVLLGSAIALVVLLRSGALHDTDHDNDAYQLLVLFAGGILVGLVLLVGAILRFRVRD